MIRGAGRPPFSDGLAARDLRVVDLAVVIGPDPEASRRRSPARPGSSSGSGRTSPGPSGRGPIARPPLDPRPATPRGGLALETGASATPGPRVRPGRLGMHRLTWKAWLHRPERPAADADSAPGA